MGGMASQITSLTIVHSGAGQRKIKAPRHWPLCGEFTGEFLAQRSSNAEMFSFDDVIMWKWAEWRDVLKSQQAALTDTTHT